MRVIDYDLLINTCNIAFSYLRLSSDRQLKGDGLRRQMEDTEHYCKENGLVLDETLQDLGYSGFTGANLEKVALGEFLKRVGAREIPRGSHLIVESLDRLSRDKVMKAFRVFSEILEAGIVIHTLADQKVYTEKSVNENMADLLISITYMIRAHDESRMKVLRQRGAWKTKRAEAATKKMTRRAPAWLIAETGDDGEITFREHPKRGPMVRMIFEELANGIGRDKIARRLNKEGEPAWGHGGKWHGREWHGGTIQKITDSRAVLGEFQPGKTIIVTEDGETKRKRVPDGEPIKDYYPQVVPDELWLRARHAADARKTTKVMNTGGRKGTVYSNLFGGFVRCGHCNSPMNYRDRGPRSTIVLRCSGNRNGTCDNEHRYSYQALERAVLNWVTELDLTDDTSAEATEIELEIATLTLKRNELTHEAQDLITQFKGKSRFATTRVLKCEKEIEGIEAEIAALQKKLDLLKGAVAPNERKAAILELLAKMEAATGPDRYAIRARLAQSLREIVLSMRCMLGGRVHFALRGGQKHYWFEDGEIRSVISIDDGQTEAQFWAGENVPVLHGPKPPTIPENFYDIHDAILAGVKDD